MRNACMLTHIRVHAGSLCMLLHSLGTSVLAYDVPHAVPCCACCLSVSTRRVSCCAARAVSALVHGVPRAVLCCAALAAGTGCVVC
jgi:hypothetical protein